MFKIKYGVNSLTTMTEPHKKIINYISEVSNNANRARIHLGREKHIDIACVYCVKFYRYFHGAVFDTTGENTLVCDTCEVTSMVPIIPSSCIYEMDGNRQMDVIELWNKEWFNTPIDDDDSGSDTGSFIQTNLDLGDEYTTYEYDDAEETKEPTDIRETSSPPQLILPPINQTNPTNQT